MKKNSHLYDNKNDSWRCISGAGIILGVVLTALDLWVIRIPYVIIIPLEIISIILIFAGLIIRKRQMTHAK